MIIQIKPELPCGTVNGSGICGKPASVAHVDPGAHGSWIMLPICKECTDGMAKLYGLNGSEDKRP